MWSDRDGMSSVDEIDLMRLGRRSVAGIVDMVLSYVEGCWTSEECSCVCMISAVNFAPLHLLAGCGDDGRRTNAVRIRSSELSSKIARRST